MTIQEFNKTKKGVKRPPFTKEWKDKIGDSQRGKKKPPRSETYRKNISESQKKHSSFIGKKGDKHPRWRGGITTENNKIRNSPEYKLWRWAVFTRDNFTCIWCGDNRGGNLEADHIQLFVDYPELRFAIDNGRTLCERCHKKRHHDYKLIEERIPRKQHDR
jgi:5-methylcytosine-specific restriction endonuclease McrA